MKFNTLSILLAGTFLTTSAVALTLEPSLDNSAISYSKSTSNDYNFTVDETDSEGNITTVYYKINLDKNKLSTSSSISWTELDSKPEDMTNVVAVNLPNKDTRYFQYSYTLQDHTDYTEVPASSTDVSIIDPTDEFTYEYVGLGINNASGNEYGDIDKKVFQNNKVTGNFEHNEKITKYYNVYGGTIFNSGIVGNVVADFINNSIELTISTITDMSEDYLRAYTYIRAYGGAIFNGGTFGNVTGNFVGNYIKATGDAHGGAISNFAANSATVQMGDITGDFIGNYVDGKRGYTYGGAISNFADRNYYSSTAIGNITGNFINNYAASPDYGYSFGGAISNFSDRGIASIEGITGNFIGNYAVYGGAISNYSEGGRVSIGAISGDFIGNHAVAGGGAINNYDRLGSVGTVYIESISGNFIGNYAETDKGAASGGAIWNYTGNGDNGSLSIGDITADFIGNYVISGGTTGSDRAYGGAISNNSEIGDITGDFISNYITSGSEANGGAISNYNGSSSLSIIGNITGNFIGNYALTDWSGHGGAIHNTAQYDGESRIGNIVGNFVENYTSSHGGAIYNKAEYGDFLQANIGSITGDFIRNHATRVGGAILNYAFGDDNYAKIGNITGDFINNYTNLTGTSSADGSGGAIFNSAAYSLYTSSGSSSSSQSNNSIAEIGDIEGNFIGNYVKGGNYNVNSGGAIHNGQSSDGEAKIGNITGNFIGNYISGGYYGQGGAIYNTGTLGDITGDFIENYVSGSRTDGGAIYNTGVIGIIEGDFLRNHTGRYGGAIYNESTLGNLGGDFASNYAGTGGAIYNTGTLGDLTGEFTGNHASTGGAIYNTGTIGNLTKDFVGNYASGSGGAIYNAGKLGNITGDFIDSYAGSGGVIYNTGTIESITGAILNSYASSSSSASGGIIYNTGTIKNFTGDLINYYAKSTSSSSSYYARGGAIYNSGTIVINTDNDVTNNYVQANYGSASGGAIYNTGSGNLGDLGVDIINNYAKSTNGSASGGAIYNDATIGQVGSITGNYASGYSSASGGAIYNSGTIIINAQEDITNNYVQSTSGSASGGFVYNTGSGDLGDIGVDILNNHAVSTSGSASGGAIYNSATIGQIGSITNNYASGYSAIGGAIYNTGTIEEIIGDIIDNHVISTSTSSSSYYAQGGAIYNSGKIVINTDNDITNNYVQSNYASASGGFVYNTGSGDLGDIDANIINNYAESTAGYAFGGAIYNTATIGLLTGDISGNYAIGGGYYARGGAIYNTGTIEGIVGNITDNYVKGYINTSSNSSSYNYKSLGGAIYTTKDMNFISDGNIYSIAGNYTEDKRGKIYNGIFVSNSSTTALPIITLDTTGGGAWIVNDNIEGGYDSSSTSVSYNGYGYKLVLVGDDTPISETGTTTQYVNINNAIINAEEVSVDGTTLRFGSYQHDDKTAKNWNGKGKFVTSLDSNGTEISGSERVTSLSLNNAVFDIANERVESVKLKNYSASNSFLHIDLNPDAMIADILNINGNVEGVTNLIVHASSDTDIKGQGNIIFAKSVNDTMGHEGSFVLSRVYGSPYMYYVTHSSPAASSNNWYVGMDETNENTDTGGGDDNTGGGDDNTGGDADDDASNEEGVGIGSSTGDSSLIINPTLDTIIKEGEKLTGNYELTALGSEELPEGAEKVIIDGVEYYFTPSGENADLLKNLAHTPALNLVENENGIFSFGGKTYSYDISQIPESAFYYDGGNVVVKTNKIFLSDRIKPYSVETDGDSTFAITSYDGTVQYYKYAYSTKGRITEIDRVTVLEDNTNTDFRYITSSVDGGAIYNSANVSSITGDFVQNKVEGADDFSGGAIYNDSEIGKIVGDFLENSVETSGENAEGGAIYNNSNIDEIRGSFVANHVDSISSAIGGAIVNNATIGNITGHFVGNYAKAETTSDGGSLDINSLSATAAGALHNLGVIGDITGDFIGNYSSGGLSLSGAILNAGSINSITGDFIGNYSEGNLLGLSLSLGGTMTNAGYIGSITGDFVDNHAGIGGAIGDLSFLLNLIGGTGAEVGIQSIKGDFINNSADYAGGAIASFGITKSIDGDFINNKVKSTSVGFGGAVATVLASDLKNINSNFKNNGVDAVTYANGGAFTNANIVDQFRLDETSDFINTVSNIKGSMTDNYAIASGDSGIALGGGIYSLSSINLTSDGKSQQISGNYTKDSTGKQYNAIFASNVYDLLVELLSQDEETMSQIKMFTGLEEFKPIISVNTLNGGNWTINDSISGGVDGTLLTTIMTLIEGLAGEELGEIPVTIPTKTDYSAQYYLNFIGNDTVDAKLGTTTQYVNMNNAIVNAGKVNVENTTLRFGAYQHEDTTAKNWDAKGKFIAALNDDGSENLDAESVTSLSLNNAVFDIANGYMETVNLKNYSATDSFVHLDVDVENMTSDVINVKGDVDGITKLVIHASSDKDIRGQGQILFAESFGDTKGNEGSFEVARVYSSPYLYDVVYEGVENTTTETTSKDNTWFFEMNDKENSNKDETPVVPTPDTPDTPVQPLGPIKVAPEVIATVAVKTAGLSQTNGMVYNIMRKVGVNRLFCPGCGFYDYNWDGEAFHNVWVDTTYNGLTIEAPVEIDAKVWGIEAGSDLQHDLNNKLGIFVSYRQGNYEMDGKGEKYYSNIGSEIDIDSYLAGLYYRYDRNNWYAFATLYGGMQNAEIQTDDGVANYDTDGIEFGGSIEAGYNYALTRKLSVTPSLGAFYSQISYDDATDNVGKTVNYNDLKQVELEAGAKFAYTQYTDNGFYSLYVKPSVVQTLIDGDEIEVTKLGKVDTIEDKTLGRVELGGNIGFNDNWSAYGWANYTFGSDYEATSLGAGLNYAW